MRYRTALKKAFLVFGDLVVYWLSLYLVVLWRYGQPISTTHLVEHLRIFTIFYPIWLFVFYVLGLYDVAVIRVRLTLTAFTIRALIIGAILTALLFYFVPGINLAPKTNLMLFVILFGLIFYLWRVWFISFFDRLLASQEQVAILWTNKAEKKLAEHLQARPIVGYKIVGSLQLKPHTLAALVDEVNAGRIQTIVLDSAVLDNPQLSPLLFRFIPRVRFKSLTDFYEQVENKIPLELLSYGWFFRSLREDEKKLHETAKRILDILVSLVALTVMIVVFPFVYAAIQLEDAGPVFYRQKRVGRFGQIFEVIKFRSMKVDSEGGKAQWAKKNDDRTTRIGKILRKTSLDELPQCLNILSGVMSAVGPRPERPEFTEILDKEIPFYEMRHLVKPGLTGWAQINYPYGASVEDARRKLEYDLYYVKHRSFILDIKTILKTFGLYLKNERAKLAH